MTDVNPAPVSEEQNPVIPEVVAPAPAPGEKTDPALLLNSLHEEREKRRVLEAELQTLRQPAPADVFSDEGKAILSRVEQLETELKSKNDREALLALENKFPALKDKAAEFEAYRQDNPGKLDTVAKAFLVDQNLIETPARKGLERNSGGGRTPPQQGLSAAEVKDLRDTNFRQYSKLLREGKISV